MTPLFRGLLALLMALLGAGAHALTQPQARAIADGDNDARVQALSEAGASSSDAALAAYVQAMLDDAVALAVELARPGARVLLGGIPAQDSTTFPASTARRKGLTLVMVRRMREMYPRTTARVAQGRVDVRSLVTHTFGLADAAEAFRTAHVREGLKVVVEPQA